MAEYTRIDPAQFEDPLSNYDSATYTCDLERALAEESVTEITSKPFIQVMPTNTVREAIEKMATAQSASVTVVDEGRVVGILTERDVLERVAERYAKLANRPVSEVMTSNPEVVYDTDPAAAALASIAVAGHRHVPVLGMDGSVRGVITPRRVFDFVEQYFES